MEETDPVHIEMALALAHGSAVIPVLIDEAVMPQPSELPDSLKHLVFRNAAYVDSGRDFNLHMDRLIRSMDTLLSRGQPSAPAEPPTKKRPRLKWVLISILAAISMMTPKAAKDGPPPVPSPSSPSTPQPPPQTIAPSTPRPAVQAVPPPKCTSEATVAFQDSFVRPAAGWGDPSTDYYFADGQMVFFFKKPGGRTWLYQPLRFKNASVCVTVKAPLQANKLNGNAAGGVVFWAVDYSNYYRAQVYLDGTFQVYRRLENESGKEWIPVVTRTKSEHIRAGLGAINELQVTTKDKTGTFYVNGQKLVDFRGQPSKDGGAVGLYGEADDDRGGEWRFLGITVVDDDAPAPKPTSAKATRAATTPITCKGDKASAFADDFKNQDAGWGEMKATAYYDGGNMVLKPMPDQRRTLLYRAMRYANATVCANMKWPTEPVQPNETTRGGLVFWGTNHSNFYQASLYRDGTYAIQRLVQDTWYSIKKRTKADSIKTVPDAVNQLKVQMVNNKATLYINDVQIVEFWGQTPPHGGAVGLYAQSDKERQNTWRFLDIVVVE
jgi:hypothetical protein